MKSYRDPSFQDRVGQAGEAKKKALEQLRARPQVDEKTLAERQAARLIRETAERQRQAAKREAKAAAATQAENARAAAVQAVPTDAERKAARDARYAARKSRR